MKLYLTVDRGRRAHNGTIYPQVGGYVEAPTWIQDKKKGWATGLMGCSTESNQSFRAQKLDDGYIFLEIEVDDVDVVKRPTMYRFKKGKVIREWVIGHDTYKELWSLLSGINLVRAGEQWEITQEMREEGWDRLTDKELYWAGREWSGVTKEMKEEGMKRLGKKALLAAIKWWVME